MIVFLFFRCLLQVLVQVLATVIEGGTVGDTLPISLGEYGAYRILSIKNRTRHSAGTSRCIRHTGVDSGFSDGTPMPRFTNR